MNAYSRIVETREGHETFVAAEGAILRERTNESIERLIDDERLEIGSIDAHEITDLLSIVSVPLLATLHLVGDYAYEDERSEKHVPLSPPERTHNFERDSCRRRRCLSVVD